jgi:hypothetical protein
VDENSMEQLDGKMFNVPLDLEHWRITYVSLPV